MAAHLRGGKVSPSPLLIHQAVTEKDAAEAVKLLIARADWLQDHGSDQWGNFREKKAELLHSALKRTWLLRERSTGKVVGTIAFVDADAEFWTPEEREVPSVYVAKLATAPEATGQGLGHVLLGFAMYSAYLDWRSQEVRFDAWKTSPELHRYYEHAGWTHLRTVDLPHRRSGALFSRPVDRTRSNELPVGLEIAPYLPNWKPREGKDLSGELWYGGNGE
ncbi:GNAT family N-acetyltransferase [Amycolatopsis sp. NPDC058986]|uniref:GNAT family N-acetyltransferase n=1 Tax=unclassified Amycolatopsis TaxID=2618356 RepID=UPI00366CD9DB